MARTWSRVSDAAGRETCRSLREFRIMEPAMTASDELEIFLVALPGLDPVLCDEVREKGSHRRESCRAA